MLSSLELVKDFTPRIKRRFRKVVHLVSQTIWGCLAPTVPVFI